MSIANATNKFTEAKWIVNPTSGLGTHTTIASALTDASSGDTIFITEGTYSENPTLKAGVNLTAFMGDANTPTVTISGKVTASYTGTASISNIRLQTNSDNCLTMTGTNATILNLNNCYINVTNNAGVNCAVSNTSSALNMYSCKGDVSGNFAFYTYSGTGTSSWQQCYFTNSGATTTAATQSAGTIAGFNCTFFMPISISSTAAFNIYYSQISTTTVNATSLTMAGTSSADTAGCRFASGTATPLSVGSGCTFNAYNFITASSNAATVSGSGSIVYNSIAFTTAGTIAPTVTAKTTYVGPISFDNGTNSLSTYAEGTFTPVAIGATTAGTGTYAYQIGRYVKIGTRVFIYVAIAWTTHTGTGTLRITSMPFTVKNTSNYVPGNGIYFDNATTNDVFFYSGSANNTYLTATLRSGTPGQAVSIAANYSQFGNIWYEV